VSDGHLCTDTLIHCLHLPEGLFVSHCNAERQCNPSPVSDRRIPRLPNQRRSSNRAQDAEILPNCDPFSRLTRLAGDPIVPPHD